MKLDLHMHTNASDGARPPEAVVREAGLRGLDVIAVTDHDTTAGYSEAVQVGAEVDVQVIPALEVSSSHGGRDIHVLGYFVDPDARTLRAHESRALGRRESRMLEMLDRLSGMGIDVPFEAVERAAGPDRVALGRPHLAQALVAEGHVDSVQEAFNTLIADGGPAFVAMHLLTPMDAIRVIEEAGGIPVWAHPPTDLIDALVGPMIEAGLRGMEVYRPRNRRDLVLRLERICQTTGLFPTGGSDWHGPAQGAVLGDFYITADDVEAFLEAGDL
jgi:predicted metal-dependent phosphoesterase TrpH